MRVLIACSSHQRASHSGESQTELQDKAFCLQAVLPWSKNTALFPSSASSFLMEMFNRRNNLGDKKFSKKTFPTSASPFRSSAREVHTAFCCLGCSTLMKFLIWDMPLHSLPSQIAAHFARQCKQNETFLIDANFIITALITLPKADGTNYQRLSLLHNTCSRSEYKNSSATFFSPKESQKQTEFCLPPRQPDLHFHTLQPQKNVLNTHKGDKAREHSTSKGLGPQAQWNKEPLAHFLPAPHSPSG